MVSTSSPHFKRRTLTLLTEVPILPDLVHLRSVSYAFHVDGPLPEERQCVTAILSFLPPQTQVVRFIIGPSRPPYRISRRIPLPHLGQLADTIDWTAIERQLKHCDGLRTLEITTESPWPVNESFLALPDVQRSILSHFSVRFRPFVCFL